MSIVRKNFIKYNCSVLFVEEDKSVQELAKDILIDRVNNLFLADNSEEAFNIYSKYNPDILITDIVMPGQNGFELTKKIKEANNDIEIIISSTFNEIEYLTKSIEIGASSFIVKPFNEKKVLNAIEKSWNTINLKRELKRKDEELKLINKELENRIKEKTETLLLSNIGHELRTPLNGIIGMASLLEKTNLDDKQLEYINLLKSSANTLQKLLSNIMDITRIESGKIQLFNEKFNLNNKIKEVIDSFLVQVSEKNLEIKCKIDSKIPSFLFGDFVKLQQILNNLISNAIKFTERGSIELTVKLLEEYSDKILLLFIVEDTGIGIPEEKFNLLFKRFCQIDNRLTKEYVGLGLGLAISKELVEVMGGKIWLESKPDKGSKFYFTVQLASF
ncbi:MAG TPA: ATP-binding protein [Bacteroidota bacterium]|nr:ATP-binding protein [Bacteroidota bacterium]